MGKPEMITVSTRELLRLRTVQAVVDTQLPPGVAARRLEISDRQLRRLVNRYRAQGAAGLVSGHRGRPSNRRLPDSRQDLITQLIREQYADFGPTLAREKLEERHGLKVGKETVRRLMMAAQLWVPRKQRPPRIYQPRARRSCCGELIQIDGSEHAWFEDRAPSCVLLVYVDDATSRIMALRFTSGESTFAYFAATRSYVEQHGKPIAFYSDKASVFRVNNVNGRAGNGHTQFARALYELNIEGIFANSSQAKGRVERAHSTLQDRLVKELRLQNINTVEQANAYVPSFIADYNRRFAKCPYRDHNAHRPLRSDDDLDLIFTVREPRRVSNSLTIQFDKMLYLFEDTPAHRTLVGKYIDVYLYPSGRVEPRAHGEPLRFVTYDRLSQISQHDIVDNKRLSEALRVAQLVQQKRDDQRSKSIPGTETQPRRYRKLTGKKSGRRLDYEDLNEAIDVALLNEARPQEESAAIISNPGTLGPTETMHRDELSKPA